MKATLALWVTVLMIVFSPRAARSADVNPMVSDAAIDMAVPDSPGFIALGFGPHMLEQPGSPREFAVSILHGVDTNGNVQSGMSIETAPALWYGGRETPLREYRERHFLRLLNRALFSFAVTHGDSTNDRSTRFALGLRLTPWDDGDPRMDENLSTCLRDAAISIRSDIQKRTEELMNERNLLQKNKEIIEERSAAAKQRSDPEQYEVLMNLLNDFERKIQDLEKQRDELLTMNFSELNQRSSDALIACRRKKDHRDRLWNKSSWSISIVPTFTSATGTEDDLKSSGTVLGTSFALGLRDTGQLILHTRYRGDEIAPDPYRPGRTFEKDSLRAGARVRFGDPDLNFSVEGVHITERSAVHRRDKKIQYGAGLEHRLADDFWLVFTVGREKYDNKDNNIVVIACLRWAYTPPPTKKY